MPSELLPGENLILRAHQHWIVVVKSLLIPVLLLVVVAIVDATVKSGTGIPHFRTIVSLAAAAIAGLWLIVVWIRWQSTAYTLTDQRIKIETGVFGRSSKTIPIDRIQDCTTRQTLFGRMLGYGRVEVDAAGAQGAEVLDHLPNPGSFRDEVFVQSERRRGGPSPVPVPANPSGV
ncbi:MAG TPA: PH domain-containing protein [Candidatus Dormibacteraeota bacterium]|nr:PH domain-containing protein [Candidatus Dormibacteraeota bacterium]